MTEWDFASQVLQWICAGSWSDGLSKVIVIILCGCVVIQIAPCKAKPITAVVKVAGTALTADVTKQLTELQSHIAEREMLDARNRILRFADECRRHERHSEEFFAQIIEDIDTYESYCSKHSDFRNSKCVEAIKVIRSAYSRCVSEDDFA
jgi:hypothetical protein